MFAKASVLALALVAGLAVVACTSSTTEKSAATVSGVCGKMSTLSCGKSNCVEVMELAQKRCPAKTFQAFLDCASVAEMRCETQNGNDVAVVETCAADLSRVNACAAADDQPSSAPSPAPTATAPGSTCTEADTSPCTAWTCLCRDGEPVKVASCTNGTCATPTVACKKGNPELERLCAPHGGT